MDKSELLQHTRWDILQQIGTGKTTASDIAAGAKTSLPNTSQQLRLLEAHGLIERVREKRTTPGKPRNKYRIKRPFSNVTLAANHIAEQSFLFANEMQLFVLSSLFVPTDEQPFLIKGIFQHDVILDTCSIAYVRSTDSLELLFITEAVEKVRKEFSNITVTFQNKSRKLVAWTHSVEEIRDGLERHEQYFTDLMKHKVLHDPDNRFEQVKQ